MGTSMRCARYTHAGRTGTGTQRHGQTTAETDIVHFLRQPLQRLDELLHEVEYSVTYTHGQTEAETHPLSRTLPPTSGQSGQSDR